MEVSGWVGCCWAGVGFWGDLGERSGGTRLQDSVRQRLAELQAPQRHSSAGVHGRALRRGTWGKLGSGMSQICTQRGAT